MYLDIAERLVEDELRALVAVGAHRGTVELEFELGLYVPGRAVAHPLKVGVDLSGDGASIRSFWRLGWIVIAFPLAESMWQRTEGAILAAGIYEGSTSTYRASIQG